MRQALVKIKVIKYWRKTFKKYNFLFKRSEYIRLVKTSFQTMGN